MEKKILKTLTLGKNIWQTPWQTLLLCNVNYGIRDVDAQKLPNHKITILGVF